MTKTQKTKYLKAGAQFCPFCYNLDIDSGPLVHDDVITAVVTCNACKKVWRDIYSVTDVEEIAEGK